MEMEMMLKRHRNWVMKWIRYYVVEFDWPHLQSHCHHYVCSINCAFIYNFIKFLRIIIFVIVTMTCKFINISQSFESKTSCIYMSSTTLCLIYANSLCLFILQIFQSNVFKHIRTIEIKMQLSTCYHHRKISHKNSFDSSISFKFNIMIMISTRLLSLLICSLWCIHVIRVDSLTWIYWHWFIHIDSFDMISDC